MNYLNITESTTDEIINLIATKIRQNLDDVSVNRGDFTVTLPEPQSYFIYENAINLKCPAVYVICDSIDARLERGQNHINAEMKYVLSVVFEEKDAEKCVRGLYRYVDAMWNTVDHQQILRADFKAKNVLKITNIDYSGLQQNKDQNDNIFRKEAMLTLMVEHFETEEN